MGSAKNLDDKEKYRKMNQDMKKKQINEQKTNYINYFEDKMK